MCGAQAFRMATREGKKNVWIMSPELLNECRALMIMKDPAMKATDERVIHEALSFYRQMNGGGTQNGTSAVTGTVKPGDLASPERSRGGESGTLANPRRGEF